MMKVLFVCMGNICRSPMAEGVFQDKVNKAGLGEQFVIDSAGTGSWNVGDPAHPGTLTILRQNKIAYNGRARMLITPDLSGFDYILAMDRQNLSHIMRHANQVAQGAKANMFTRDAKRPEIALFLSYANRAGATHVQEVPDPFYDNNFEEVYGLVQIGTTALLQHIRAKHQL
jgi:protein-tyrosine phosphatase